MGLYLRVNYFMSWVPKQNFQRSWSLYSFLCQQFFSPWCQITELTDYITVTLAAQWFASSSSSLTRQTCIFFFVNYLIPHFSVLVHDVKLEDEGLKQFINKQKNYTWLPPSNYLMMLQSLGCQRGCYIRDQKR